MLRVRSSGLSGVPRWLNWPDFSGSHGKLRLASGRLIGTNIENTRFDRFKVTERKELNQKSPGGKKSRSDAKGD